MNGLATQSLKGEELTKLAPEGREGKVAAYGRKGERVIGEFQIYLVVFVD
jgi:hypothetical protein